MKAREKRLSAIIEKIYGAPGNVNLPPAMSIPAEYTDFLKEVYFSLGGIMEKGSFQFGGWDIVTRDFIIELDEEQHFNRYRAMTLESPFYNDYKLFNVEEYKNLCRYKEMECLRKAKRGGYWTNPSTEKQFGPAAPNGDFSGNGSPRWKQRAFYDFFKDLYGTAIQIPVVRISIYDELKTEYGSVQLGKALEDSEEQNIYEFIKTKIATSKI